MEPIYLAKLRSYEPLQVDFLFTSSHISKAPQECNSEGQTCGVYREDGTVFAKYVYNISYLSTITIDLVFLQEQNNFPTPN